MNQGGRIAIIIWVILCWSQSSAQDIFKGRVVDHGSRRTLAYANIGVLNGIRGTCADAKGNYTLDLTGAVDKDTLICSHIGYKSDTFLVQEFRKKYKTGVAIMFLSKAPPLPVNVMDYDDSMTKKALGNSSTSKSKTTHFPSNELGTELGVLIPIKSDPTYLQSLNFNIVQNEYDSLVLRVNLYFMYSGEPYNIMHEEDIIVKAHEHSGKVSVNLLPYKLIVDEDFFVSLEWITPLGDSNNNSLLFSGGSKGSGNFCRRASQGHWIHYKGVGPAISVTSIY